MYLVGRDQAKDCFLSVASVYSFNSWSAVAMTPETSHASEQVLHIMLYKYYGPFLVEQNINIGLFTECCCKIAYNLKSSARL